jgi:hypothetical protein
MMYRTMEVADDERSDGSMSVVKITHMYEYMADYLLYYAVYLNGEPAVDQAHVK